MTIMKRAMCKAQRYSLNLQETTRSLGNDNIIDKVVGDALIRDEDGKDSAFQFVIERAKLMSEVTLTMQAKFPWSAKIA